MKILIIIMMINLKCLMPLMQIKIFCNLNKLINQITKDIKLVVFLRIKNKINKVKKLIQIKNEYDN